LATEIARKILRREIGKQPEVALDAVREALELAAGARRIQVHLAPADHETLSDQVRQLAAAIQPLAAAEILPDAEISPGGCRLTTEFGPIDMQIETQLARIEQELA
jgi:flagellar biosynthesis/type III secretory pathway protein FliH